MSPVFQLFRGDHLGFQVPGGRSSPGAHRFLPEDLLFSDQHQVVIGHLKPGRTDLPTRSCTARPVLNFVRHGSFFSGSRCQSSREPEAISAAATGHPAASTHTILPPVVHPVFDPVHKPVSTGCQTGFFISRAPGTRISMDLNGQRKHRDGRMPGLPGENQSPPRCGLFWSPRCLLPGQTAPGTGPDSPLRPLFRGQGPGSCDRTRSSNSTAFSASSVRGIPEHAGLICPDKSKPGIQTVIHHGQHGFDAGHPSGFPGPG